MTGDVSKELAKEVTDAIRSKILIGFFGAVFGSIAGVYMLSYRVQTLAEVMVAVGLSIALVALTLVCVYLAIRFGLVQIMMFFGTENTTEVSVDDHADSDQGGRRW